MNTHSPEVLARLGPVALTVLGAIVLVGFFSGTRTPSSAFRPSASVREQQSEHSPMPKYKNMGDTRRGVHQGMYNAAFDSFRVGSSASSQKVDRGVAVEDRQKRRAYDGAPPTVPHVVAQQDAPSCLVCHKEGVVIGGKTARAISHPEYANCLQCHVVGSDPRPVDIRSQPPENVFAGLASRSGARAWQGAPPSMPHSTWMRDNCTSCHGPAGHPGLKTSHPERHNCLQCHPPVGSQEQRFPVVSVPAVASSQDQKGGQK